MAATRNRSPLPVLLLGLLMFGLGFLIAQLYPAVLTALAATFHVAASLFGIPAPEGPEALIAALAALLIALVLVPVASTLSFAARAGLSVAPVLGAGLMLLLGIAGGALYIEETGSAVFPLSAVFE